MKGLSAILIFILLLLVNFNFGLKASSDSYDDKIIDDLLNKRRLCETGYSQYPDSALIYTLQALETAESIYGFGSRRYVDIMADYLIPDFMDRPNLLEDIYDIVTTRFNPDSAYVSSAYYELGRVMSCNREYDRADYLYRLAAERMESVEDSLMTEYQRALNWYEKSGHDLCFMMLPVLDKAYKASSPYDNILRFKCYHQLANNYSRLYMEDYPDSPLGFYELAEKYFDDADEIDQTQMLYDKYKYLLNIDHRAAIKCIDRIIEILENKGDPELLNWKVMAYIIKGDYFHNELLDDLQALVFYAKGNELLDAPFHDGLRIKRVILGRLFTILLPFGMFDEACHVGEILVSLSEKYGSEEEKNKNLINLADCYLKSGKIGDSKKVIDIIERTLPSDISLMRDFYKVKGNYFYKIGDFTQAYQDYAKANKFPQTKSEDILLIEAMLRASSHVDHQQTRFIADSLNTKVLNTISNKILNISPQYREYWHLVCDEVLENEIYAAKNGVDLSLNLLELSLFRKGLLLRTQNEIRKILFSNSDLKEKYEFLNALKRELSGIGGAMDSKDFKNLQNQIDSIEWDLSYEALNNSPDLKEELFIDIDKIKKTLQGKDLAIEFIVTGTKSEKDNYYTSIIFSKNTSPIFIDLKEINDSITYKNIWGKMKPFLEEADNIYFSPDGKLNGIAIEFLQDENDEMAIDKYKLHRVMHLNNIHGEEAINNKKLVAFGISDYNSPMGEAETIDRSTMTDLPNVKFEMQSLQDKFGETQSEIYFNDNATEESFKNLNGRPIGILHFSTHGIYRDYDSLKDALEDSENFDQKIAQRLFNIDQESLSALVLRQGVLNWEKESLPAKEDDILTAEEIENMFFPELQLTVLSACDSGLGEINGEGIQGLQRAFKIVGSKNIICSPNKVDDYWSAQFMGELYEKLTDGCSIYEAFKTAQKNIKEAAPDNPKAWSSYILIE